MNPDETLELYDLRRSVSRPMANELLRRVGRASLNEVGRRVGLLRGGTLVLDNESELDVLGDLAVFDLWKDGENLVRRVLREAPPAEGTMQREIMEARCDARFSIFTSERVEPGVGVYFRDMFRGREETLVVDRGMAASPLPPFIAMRLLRFPEFAMSTGAGIPVTSREATMDVVGALRRRFGEYDDAAMQAMTPPEWSEFAFITVKVLLAHAQTRHVAYANRPDEVDPRALTRDDYGPRLMAPEPRVGRNEPCPCGSGKKYKKCHGAAGAG